MEPEHLGPDDHVTERAVGDAVAAMLPERVIKPAEVVEQRVAVGVAVIGERAPDPHQGRAVGLGRVVTELRHLARSR